MTMSAKCRHLVSPGGRNIPSNRIYCSLRFRTKCESIKTCQWKEVMRLESGT